MNSPYFQDGDMPPLCTDLPRGVYRARRDPRTPADLLCTLPKLWKRPWRVKLERRKILNEMFEQFKEASKRTPLTLDNSLIIKTELLSQADFDAIFNPDWRWVDGVVYRIKDALASAIARLKLLPSRIYERTQVL